MKVDDSGGATAAVEFAIEEGTLEIGSIPRKVWRRSPVLPPSTEKQSTIVEHQTELTLQEFARPWTAFRATKKALTEEVETCPEVDDSPRSNDNPHVRGKVDLQQQDNILRHYEPNSAFAAPLFPHELHAPSYFSDVTAVDGSIAFKVSCKVVFNIGAIEPVTCRLALYDVNSGGRASEEFVFQVNPPLSGAKDARFIKSAMFYVLPTHYAQSLYLVLQTSKVLQGDAEIASLHYCQPEKFMSEAEQAKLVDKAAECTARLGGSIHQPLAWGAVTLSEGIRQMTLYRQKASFSDDARLAMVVDASKGTLKEKTVPCICELDIEKVDDVTIRSAKKRTVEMKISPTATALLYLVDPMFHTSTGVSKDGAGVAAALPDTLQWCREIQPFCPPQATTTWGPCGSGPVAVSYVHALYLYPHAVDRFQHRNVAVKVQLFHEATELACFASSTSLGLATDMYCHVSYHQKSPSFEDEIKILLPLTLSPSHHVVFTFYQVHCKKMAAGKLPMDIIGRAVLPIVDKQHGAALGDATHTLAVADGGGGNGVVSTLASNNNSAGIASGAGAPLFQVRSRLLSTVYSQDSAIQSFFHLWSQLDIPHDEMVARIVTLKTAPSVGVRHHALRLFRQLLVYLCHPHRPIRTAAFATMLTLFDKCSMSTSGPAASASGTTGRKHSDGGSSIVLQYIDAIFDEPAASSTQLNGDVPPDGCRPFKVYEAVIAEWTALVTEACPSPPSSGRGSATSSTGGANEPRRLAMAHANALLHLALKSIALSITSTSPRHHALPQPMADVHLVAGLLDVLLDASLLTDDGFIARKDMLQSLGRFALALFWVVKSPVPALWIQRAVPRLASTKDSAVMIHMTFPFLRILADADAFVAINTTVPKLTVELARSNGRPPSNPAAAVSAVVDGDTKPAEGNNAGLEDAWLAQLLVTTLLQVAADQSEEKIKSQAMAILRRLLVVQMSGPKASQKERVAMMLLPVLPKMLALAHRLDGDDSTTASTSPDSLKRDLLLCIVATLQHVPQKQLKGYNLSKYIECDRISAAMRFWKPKALLTTPTYERHHHTVDVSDWQNEALQAHVLQAIQTLRSVMDTFLGDGLPWQQVLSPDCADQSKPPQLSLLDIEVYMKQRNNRRSQLTDEANTMSPRSGAGSNGAGASGAIGTVSGTGTQPPGGPGSAHHRSLPRNWGKHYMAQRKNSMDTKPEDGNGSSDKADNDMDSHAKRLATAVARTLVTTIQTLVHEFNRCLGAHQPFLATVVDLWYVFLTRIGHGHFDQDVVSSVLAHLTAFLGRFQTPLFAHSNVLLMTDDAWCERLVVLAASGTSTAPLAATFVCDLLATSFDQRGNFLRVEHALIQVVAKQLHLPFLPNVLDAMDAFPGVPPFRPRLAALVASLRRVVTTWQQYEAAMTTLGTTWPTNNGVTMGQVESLTDALVAVAMAIPPEEDGLFDVHVKFIDALARVHVKCGQFAEAAKCKLHLVDMATTRGMGGSRRRGSRVVSTDEFALSQYKLALTYLSPQTTSATSTMWALPDMALSIAHDMLKVCQKMQNHTEYAATLKVMDTIIAGVLAQQGGAKQDNDAPPVSRYFLVAIVGTAENVPDLGVEFIYKRSAFCHVSEMMASIESGLNACFPHLKVKPISLAKPTDGTSVDDTTTVYIKATPVEPMFAGECGRMFMWSSPFAVAKHQFVRKMVLRVRHDFPYLSLRQVVLAKEEVIRCPIDTATDDIAKRTASLLKIVRRDEKGLPHDVKAITHLLKGSINTEVNGGAPEVIQTFLARDVVCINKDASPMAPAMQSDKQNELRATLLQFLDVALTVLAISRDLFRRSSHRPSPSTGGLAPTNPGNGGAIVASTNHHSADDADVLLLAPLQGEFEKAFGKIVAVLAATYDEEPENVAALKAAAAFKLGLAF